MVSRTTSTLKYSPIKIQNTVVYKADKSKVFFVYNIYLVGFMSRPRQTSGTSPGSRSRCGCRGTRWR